ncbi:uncharacterized protein LOC135343628 [Halichondria panicea]|uniref:uncharacterized protein LOC135343628 n=1 Tax=Halichondria panicea TaxID=6063 RepID=UPI00312B396B
MECSSLLCLLCSLAVLPATIDGQSPSSVMASLPMTTPMATPTGPPSSTPNRQLSLIIGLPVGVGLAVIGLGVCLLWLTCSAYCENKDHTRTASSNLPMSSNRSGNHPAHNYHNSSSVGDSRSFEPSPARPKTLNPANTTEAQEDTTTNATNNPEQVDYTNSQSERQSHDSERQSHDSSPSVDHGSMFDITLKSPEPTDIPVNQQFEVSMQH